MYTLRWKGSECAENQTGVLPQAPQGANIVPPIGCFNIQDCSGTISCLWIAAFGLLGLVVAAKRKT